MLKSGNFRASCTCSAYPVPKSFFPSYICKIRALKSQKKTEGKRKKSKSWGKCILNNGLANFQRKFLLLSAKTFSAPRSPGSLYNGVGRRRDSVLSQSSLSDFNILEMWQKSTAAPGFSNCFNILKDLDGEKEPEIYEDEETCRITAD